MGEERAKLVEVIARTYSLEQLSAVVKRALDRPLQYYSTASDLLTVVDKLLEELERTNEHTAFLLRLREWSTRPQIRGAVNAYLGIPDADAQTYQALIVLDEPFVNRQTFRTNLQQLFQTANRHVLVTRGQRATGKSYSRWLVQHVARHEGYEPVYVELPGNTVEDIVSQLINELSLPPKEFRDRLAQFSTITKGFLTALRGCTRNVLLGQRWCLIFDGYDSEKVTHDVRDFVDALLPDVADLQLPPIWMIVLGHRPAASVTVRAGVPPARLLSEDIEPLTKPDVEKFLKELAARSGAPIDDSRAATLAGEVFDGLTPPLDHDGMLTMNDRLREKISDVMGVV